MWQYQTTILHVLIFTLEFKINFFFSGKCLDLPKLINLQNQKQATSDYIWIQQLFIIGDQGLIVWYYFGTSI